MRPKVTVLNAYAVHPVDNGGGNRIHWLYKALARHADVDLVTLGPCASGSDAVHVAPGFRELRVARTPAHEAADRGLQQEAHAPVHDVAALRNIHLTPDYRTVLENSLAGSDLAVLSHPFMATALRTLRYEGPVLHESQNREHQLKRKMLQDSVVNRDLLGAVEEAERFSCTRSRLVFACSEEDAAGLLEEYGGPAEHTIVVPNGTDTGSIAFTDAAARRRIRARLGMTARPLALFLASGHRPNIEAAEHIVTAARELPEVDFAFIGNIDHAFRDRDLPPNLSLAGFVSDAERNIWLQVADLALNPMLYGGGTNLKLLDYFAAGVPVISTGIGIRGTGARDGEEVFVAPASDLARAIRRVLAAPDSAQAVARKARALVEQRFDWWSLGDRLYREIRARGLL